MHNTPSSLGPPAPLTVLPQAQHGQGLLPPLQHQLHSFVGVRHCGGGASEAVTHIWESSKEAPGSGFGQGQQAHSGPLQPSPVTWRKDPYSPRTPQPVKPPMKSDTVTKSL